MEKILIVEDSKVISSYLKRTLYEDYKDAQIFIVQSFEELKSLDLENQDITIALADIYLPDVHDLSLIDYLIEKKIPTLVMTASFDEELYSQLESKKIIDFVIKDSLDSLSHIVKQTKRLLSNRDKSVLIVDDSKTSLTHISNYLKDQMFNLIVEQNPLKALDIIKKESLDLIITDYHMPELNGIELIQKSRKYKPKDELGIIGISSDSLNSVQFLKYGANDFIKKPFLKEEFVYRVNNLSHQLDNIAELKNIVNTDYLTKIYNRKYFFENGQKYYIEAKKSNETFTVGMLDIDNFKKVNDTYGHDIGDIAIKSIADTLKNITKGQDIVARFGGEEFTILLKDISYEASKHVFENIRKTISENKIFIDDDNFIQITVSIGITENPSESLEGMLKVADERLYIAKHSGKNQVVTEDKELKMVES